MRVEDEAASVSALGLEDCCLRNVATFVGESGVSVQHCRFTRDRLYECVPAQVLHSGRGGDVVVIASLFESAKSGIMALHGTAHMAIKHCVFRKLHAGVTAIKSDVQICNCHFEDIEYNNIIVSLCPSACIRNNTFSASQPNIWVKLPSQVSS